MKKLVVVAGMLLAGMAAFSQIVDTTAPAKRQARYNSIKPEIT